MSSNKAVTLLFIISIVMSLFAINRGKPQIIEDPNMKLLMPYTRSRNILSFFTQSFHKPKKIIYGYLPYWTVEKHEYLQLDKITDIAYFGLYIKEDGSFLTETEEEVPDPGYLYWFENNDLKKFIGKAKSMDVRIALTIISHNDEVSDKFLECRECWDTLVTNTIKALDHHSITDVNLNFEYVEFQDEEKAQKYTDLAELFNKELDKKYGNSFLTVATFADSFINPRITNIESLSKVADALFIMAYDFRHRESKSAGPASPVSGIGVQSDYDLETMVKDYLSVTPPSKILLGVPYYGYNWVVESEEKLAKRVEGSEENGFSQSQAYADVMELIQEVQPEIKWDEVSKTPYFTYESPDTGATRQVFYENQESLKVKYDLVKSNNLAGIGIWALGYDGGYQELWQLLEREFVD